MTLVTDVPDELQRPRDRTATDGAWLHDRSRHRRALGWRPDRGPGRGAGGAPRPAPGHGRRDAASPRGSTSRRSWSARSRSSGSTRTGSCACVAVPIWLDDEVWLERSGDRSSRGDQLAALRPGAPARAATSLRGHVRVLPLAGRRVPATADRSRDRLAAAAPRGAENPSCRPHRDEPARTLAAARVALRRGARGSRRPMLRGVRGAAPGGHAVARRDPRGGASTPRARVIRLCRSTIVRPR